jgi:hypothetical protein
VTWTRLSDTFTDRPELLEVSRSARLLHVEALVHCNRHLTDGRLSRRALRRITDSEDLDGDVAELENVGVWVPTEDGWQVDWTDQETAEKVRARQELAAARKERHEAHKAGDHEQCNPKTCTGARDRTRSGTDDGTASGTQTSTHARTPSRPDPTRPGPKGTGSGSGAPSTDPTTGLSTGARRCSAGAIIGTDGICCAEHTPPPAGGLVVVR